MVQVAQVVGHLIRPRRIRLGPLLLSLAALALPAAADEPKIAVPSGFHVGVFASGLIGARFMAVDPAGTLLLSIPREGRVVALPDRGGSGRAEPPITVAAGLDRPHGLAFHQGALYVAETGRVLRFHYDPQTKKATEPSVIVANLPRGGTHWTRTIAFGPDGRLYVSVGSSCNVCREQDPRRAAILRYEADGSGEHIVASGIRNAVGIAFHPATGALWATINERDWWGDNLPPDYITEVKEGGFYGWPECMIVHGKAVPDERFAQGDRCAAVALPTLEIQAHSAPIGLAFYTGKQFPAQYRGSLFVAYQGSWNRSVPTGYKVVRVVFREGKAAGVEDFATGWLEGARIWGKLVDVIVGSDGALYLTSQDLGTVYRISYGQ
jgi:glucose/arabinose dehydrogenase